MNLNFSLTNPELKPVYQVCDVYHYSGFTIQLIFYSALLFYFLLLTRHKLTNRVINWIEWSIFLMLCAGIGSMFYAN